MRSWSLFLDLRRGTPEGRQQGVDYRLLALELGPVEGEEIVVTEVGLGHLGEELLFIGQGVVGDQLAANVEDAFVLAAVAEALPRGANLGMVEPEDLVVV